MSSTDNNIRPTGQTLPSRLYVYARLQDYGLLIKIRLTILVVFSALLAFLIVQKGNFNIIPFVILAIGGFAITAAANALNELLEKDFDRQMKRTADRPVAAGRMSQTEALLIAGTLFVSGIILLALFNPLTALLGATAVVTYAFLYTPLKRITPLSVIVGAIPGALPAMIGCVALEGSVSTMALVLFGIQFFWQFPHFWSIGFLSYSDYKHAGFRLVPESNGKIHPDIGLQSALFSLMLIPIALIPFFIAEMHILPCLIVVTLSILYAFSGYNLQREKSAESARLLMFSSFVYLPAALIVFYLGSI